MAPGQARDGRPFRKSAEFPPRAGSSSRCHAKDRPPSLLRSGSGSAGLTGFSSAGFSGETRQHVGGRLLRHAQRVSDLLLGVRHPPIANMRRQQRATPATCRARVLAQWRLAARLVCQVRVALRDAQSAAGETCSGPRIAALVHLSAWYAVPCRIIRGMVRKLTERKLALWLPL